MIDSNQVLRDNIGRLIVRDLAAMRREVELYPDDATPWQAVPGLSNAGGNLVLHLAGNLQHFFGAVLGNTGYVRDRDLEFSRRGATRAELVSQLDAATDAVVKTLTTMHPSTMEGVYPMEVANMHFGTDIWLMHCATHLAYHLGQLDYHRRCVTGDATIANTMSVPALLDPFPPNG